MSVYIGIYKYMYVYTGIYKKMGLKNVNKVSRESSISIFKQIFETNSLKTCYFANCVRTIGGCTGSPQASGRYIYIYIYTFIYIYIYGFSNIVLEML